MQTPNQPKRRFPVVVGLLAFSLSARVVAQTEAAPASSSRLRLPAHVCQTPVFKRSCQYIYCASADCDWAGDDFEAQGLIDQNLAVAANDQLPTDVRFWARILLAHLFRISDRPLEAWLQYRKAFAQDHRIRSNDRASNAEREGMLHELEKRLSFGKRTVRLLLPPGRSLPWLKLNGVQGSSAEEWGEPVPEREGLALKLVPGRLTVEWQEENQRNCRQDFEIKPAGSEEQRLELVCPVEELPPPVVDKQTWPLWTAWGVAIGATAVLGVLWSAQDNESDRAFQNYQSNMTPDNPDATLEARRKSVQAETTRNRLAAFTAVSGGAATVLSVWLLNEVWAGSSPTQQQSGKGRLPPVASATNVSLMLGPDARPGLGLMIQF